MTEGLGSSFQRRLALARSATDRVAERRTDEDWLAATWGDERTRVMYVVDGRTLVENDGLCFCSPSEAKEGERYLLGTDADGVAYFAVRPYDAQLPTTRSDAVAAGLREVGSILSARDAGLLVLAVGLANWHATHTHCPRCGAPTEVASAGFVRRCPADGSEHYPRTDPAVIVLVRDDSGERCLLGSSTRWKERRFSTLAGFVEPGESAEAAVVREVWEEAQVEVGEVTYLGSQPWPFPSSLMLGFHARAAGGQVEPSADGVELAEARWFTREQIQEGVADGSLSLPPGISIARRLIEEWYGGDLPDATLAW